MITANFEDHPDHRINFFRLLEAINRHAFPAMLRLNAQQFQLVMDSIIWALKHLERNIADTGLQILFDLIHNVQMSDIANDFYKTYFISLLQDILGVLTDTLHKPGFRIQSLILAKLFGILETGAITVPLWVNAVRHACAHSRTRWQQTASCRLFQLLLNVRLILRACLVPSSAVSLLVLRHFSRTRIPTRSPTTSSTFVSSCRICCSRRSRI